MGMRLRKSSYRPRRCQINRIQQKLECPERLPAELRTEREQHYVPVAVAGIHQGRLAQHSFLSADVAAGQQFLCGEARGYPAPRGRPDCIRARD